ncbi:Myosin-binding protein 7 [Heracleum sosnowskyi]|uniref:Myosin-binding protein 7 n=1 Tax=Heracleum sosnowskyi TaxID=360622 RepID=A0AAD8NEA8_9APIA|nr:Myosin-binding protein 7 [Heracleum sosnowskyi]
MTSPEDQSLTSYGDCLCDRDCDVCAACSIMNASDSGTSHAKRKFPQLEEGNSNQQTAILDLSIELEEERSASSTAANEAMSMILRLQREKAEIQMEARQFKRFAEEKMAHDGHEIGALEDLLYKREQSIQSLMCEVRAYKHRMLSYGLTEAEVEGVKGDSPRNHSVGENSDSHYEIPTYNYPPLKCNSSSADQSSSDVENDTVDVEKYALCDTPTSQDHLKDLENRINQLENSPKQNRTDVDFFGTKTVLEKVIVGYSPRRCKHIKRFSTESSSSYFATVREAGSDVVNDSPESSTADKLDCIDSEKLSNLKKVDNASEVGDDMSDRVYTIDSIHNEASYDEVRDPKASITICEEYTNTPRESLNTADARDPEITKLYLRLQALEADRESMRQALISMRTDKAQLVLLKEIAQQFCKDKSPVRAQGRKSSVGGSFSAVSIFKWVASFVFWKKKAFRSRYMSGMSPNNVGLLMLLDKGPRVGQWRCLTSTQV